MTEPGGACVATTIITEPASVLVVDDNATTRYIVSSWLRRAGHRVTEASTGQEALALVGTTEVDVVILDIRLPDLSGYEVCAQIKTGPQTQALPVIHLSATAIEPEDRTRGLARGADAYLTEPVDPRELLATVDAVLRYYRARRKAELLANRLTTLTATTLAVNAAETFDALGQAAAAGATRLFDSPAAVFLLAPDGRLRHVFAAGPGQPPESRTVTTNLLPWLTGKVLGDTAGSEVVVVSAEVWATRVPWAAIRSDVRAVLCRTKAGRPPVCIAVPAATAFP
jgi:CheY-like chemotaxis protein